MDINQPNQFTGVGQQAATYDEGLRKYMLGIYNYMTGALFLTAAVAYFVSNSPAIMGALYGIDDMGRPHMTLLGIIVAIAPIGFALMFGFKIQSMSFSTAQALFWAFSAVMGLSLSHIFLVYTGASIARAFLITAIVFGSMSLYGYTTKRDLTSMGSYMIMALWGVILSSVVNIFIFKSAGFDLVLSIISIALFVGLTAWDTQRLKAIYYQVAGSGEMAAKMAIYGAFSLYLDFINLFVQILRFVGDRR